MKEKTVLVIAALMIILMAFAISIVTVNVLSTFSASPAASISTATVCVLSTFSASPAASISPETTGGDKWVVLTITVTNDTGEEIYRILIRDQDNMWANAAGGDWSTYRISGYWVNVADNISAAAGKLSYVAENLKEALANKKSAGAQLKYAADNLEDAGGKMNISGRENAYHAGYWIDRSAKQLAQAALLLQHEPENLLRIAVWIENAADNMKQAALRLYHDTDSQALRNAGENLSAVENNLENAATYLKGGMPRLAAQAFENAADNIENAGTNLQAYTGAGAALINDAGKLLVTKVAPTLTLAGTYLERMADNLKESGTALSTIRSTYFDNAITITKDNAGITIDYLSPLFSTAIENAENALRGLPPWENENILAAGEWLREAALALDAVQGDNKLEFGSRYLGARPTSADNLLWKAGDNLANRERLNITTAASAIENIATQLTSAGTKLKGTAGKLAPSNWALTDLLNDVQLEAENYEFQIAPGGTKDFVFLWYAPITGKTYTFQLWYYDNTYAYVGGDTVSITVDALGPGLVTFKVMQTGGVENVVGTVRDNGKATITLVASEEVSELGTAYIENMSEENFLPPIEMANWTTTNNITFTYEFSVGEWDDNDPRVRIKGPWATDIYANDNVDPAYCYFVVDTRKPIFVDNGLDALEALPYKAQAGTGYLYRADNKAEQIFNGIVQDNWIGYRFGYDNLNTTVIPSIIIEWDNNTATAGLLPEENFYKIVSLSEGLNSVVRITATDWAGNSDNVYIENIFIDTKAPTITFDNIAGKTWTSGVLINDNTPEIKLTVRDPGYPTGGLGVARENLIVMLSHKSLAAANPDNFFALYAETENIIVLENKGPWATQADIEAGVFENIIDNAGAGLVDKVTLYVHVWASDNLFHDGDNGTVSSRSFIVDITAPLVTDITYTYDYSTYDTPINYKMLLSTILPISGTISAGEVGGTVTIYVDGVAVKTIVTTTTSWSTTITLTAGTVQRIEVSLTDVAGNESDKKLFGYVLADATAPTVTITAPVEGARTDKASITLEATVTKDAWETYAELTVRIDATSMTAPITATNVLTAEGKLVRAVTLVEGTNTISVSAMDPAGNWSAVKTVTVTRTVTPWGTYAIIIVIVALILAAIAIFRKR